MTSFRSCSIPDLKCRTCMLCYAFYYKEFLYFPKVSVQVTNLLNTLQENVDKCFFDRLPMYYKRNFYFANYAVLLKIGDFLLKKKSVCYVIFAAKVCIYHVVQCIIKFDRTSRSESM